MTDLFTRLIRYSETKEDFFTECLAWSLQEDDILSRQFVSTLLETKDGISLTPSSRISIETQVSFEAFPGNCIDMVIKVSDGRSIGIENKLFAPEGHEQLKRYVDLPIDHIAFITGRPGYPISEGIIGHEKYLRPSIGRDHFIWHDFFKLFDERREVGETIPTSALKELFLMYGFSPPHPLIGDLNHPDESVKRANRENMAKLWEWTRVGMREGGWRSFEPGSIAELYIGDGPDEGISWIWLDPTWSTNSLRTRFTLRDDVDPHEILERLEANRTDLEDDMEFLISAAHRKDGPVEVIDALISFDSLLGSLTSAEDIGLRIRDHVIDLYDHVIDMIGRNESPYEN